MVSDGRSAFVAATTQKFDGILLDVQMPVISGFPVTRAIRADPRSRIDIPAARRRTGGNADLLQRVHRRSIQSLRDLAPKLRRCVLEHQWAEAIWR
jgi:CheY-like chemotaxis protein